MDEITYLHVPSSLAGLLFMLAVFVLMVWTFRCGPRWLKMVIGLLLAACAVALGMFLAYVWLLGQSNWSL